MSGPGASDKSWIDQLVLQYRERAGADQFRSREMEDRRLIEENQRNAVHQKLLAEYQRLKALQRAQDC
jgi:hypothetical protein